jgi:hypothetical protein
VESGTDDEGKKIDKKILFKFNGIEYVNMSGIEPYGHGF